jgi:hypothetical protein
MSAGRAAGSAHAGGATCPAARRLVPGGGISDAGGISTPAFSTREARSRAMMRAALTDHVDHAACIHTWTDRGAGEGPADRFAAMVNEDFQNVQSPRPPALTAGPAS